MSRNSKQLSSEGAPEKLSKADFVRSLPKNTPAAEVVEKARAAGIELTEKYIYNIRSADKSGRRGRQRSPFGRAGSRSTVGLGGLGPSDLDVGMPSRRSAGRSSGGSSSAESLLRAVAAEIGLAQAIEILEEQRDQVRAVLGQ